MYTIESVSTKLRARLVIKAFKTNEARGAFLCTGSNGLKWKESSKGFKAGTYAYAGGQWHNVKSLDASVLAHI